jgi:4-amino-4-deoxy-L-arabinose transferase-like glycosyltransferase
MLSFFLYTQLSHAEVPFGEDQDAYLDAVDRIQKESEYFDGQRNPLWPLLLSFLISPGEKAYVQARFWTVFFSLFLLILQWPRARRLWGEGAGLFWIFLMAFNAVFLKLAPMVMVEGILLGLVGLFFLDFQLALKGEKSWFWPGAWLGLALLAKGTLPVLLVAVILTFVLTRRWKALLWMMATVLMFYAPFLLYRQLHFHDAFYQVSHGLSWQDFYHPHHLTGSDLHTFVKEKGWWALPKRVVSALWPSLVTALKASSLLTGNWKMTFFSQLFLMGGGLILFLRKRRSTAYRAAVFSRVTGLLGICWFFLWWFFCAWMLPVADVPRYWIPLIPLWAGVLVELWRPLEGNWFARPLKNFIFLLAIASFLIWKAPWPEVIRLKYLKHPDLSWKEDFRYRVYRRVREGIEARTRRPPLIFYGPGQLLPRNWLWPKKRVVVSWEDQGNEEKIREVLQQADFLLLDDSTRRRNGPLFLQVLKDFLVETKRKKMLSISWKGQEIELYASSKERERP